MAWTTPTTRATGDLITAAIWNTDLVNNLSYLKTEVDKHGALLADGAEYSVSNSIIETTLFTGTVPANTLGTSDFLIIRLYFRLAQTSGSSQVTTFRIKYGATTILTLAPTVTNSAGDRFGMVDVILRADGATNAQEAHGSVVYQVGNATSAPDSLWFTGTAAIDSTANQTLAITVQFAAANANYTLTSKGCVVQGVY